MLELLIGNLVAALLDFFGFRIFLEYQLELLQQPCTTLLGSLETEVADSHGST